MIGPTQPAKVQSEELGGYCPRQDARQRCVQWGYRYSPIKVELRAPELETARISGSFEAGKNELFVEGLQSYFKLDIERDGDHRIVLTAHH